MFPGRSKQGRRDAACGSCESESEEMAASGGPGWQGLKDGSGEEDLFQGGDPIASAVKGDHTESAHAAGDSDLTDFVGAGALNDEASDLIGDGHGFNDGEASGIACIFAAFTAATAVESDAVEYGGIDREVLVHFRWVGHWFFADGADAANEALRAG